MWFARKFFPVSASEVWLVPKTGHHRCSSYSSCFYPKKNVLFRSRSWSLTWFPPVQLEDGSALRILQSMGYLGKAPILEVSELPGDRNQLHRSQLVNEIRRAAEQPGICAIVDFDETLDGFYDLLNLRFQRIQLGDRLSLAATVASGSYSVLVPVHPHFQLVVCIKAGDLDQTPLPFLNRFEKYYLTPADLASHTAYRLCHGQISHHVLQNHLLQPARDRLADLVELMGPASLIGYRPTTMDSALIEALQSQEVSAALKAFSASWLDRDRTARDKQKPDFDSTLPLPDDVAEHDFKSAVKEHQEALNRMSCHGYENAGSTCYLQACLILLGLHEDQWLGSSENSVSAEVRHVIRKSRSGTVFRDQVALLEKELQRAGLIEGEVFF